jgi:hypothetical protein
MVMSPSDVSKSTDMVHKGCADRLVFVAKVVSASHLGALARLVICAVMALLRYRTTFSTVDVLQHCFHLSSTVSGHFRAPANSAKLLTVISSVQPLSNT